MIPITEILDKIRSRVDPLTTTEDDAYKMIGAIDVLDQSVSVFSEVTDLPDPSSNIGRIVYVVASSQYFVSNGDSWTSNFTSENIIEPPTTETVGELWTIGGTQYGTLGINETLGYRSSPVSVVGGFADWVTASGGNYHVVGLRENGTLWSWGRNNHGQLGDGFGYYYNRSSPVSVVGGFADWVTAASGKEHTVSIRSDGTLWAWGRNSGGQLGDSTQVGRSSPVSVVGGFTDWDKVVCGGEHTASIRSNGTLWGFGNNYRGQLGDGTRSHRSSPVSVAGGFTDWDSLSSMYRGTVALRTNGTLWAWGSNSAGTLGDGTTVYRSSPVSVVGGFTDWIVLSSGGAHVAVIRSDGTLWTWGSGYDGQLGDGYSYSYYNRSSPVSVLGGFTDWADVACLSGSTIGLRENGTLWAWGSNYSGQLGNNSSFGRSSPISVITAVLGVGESWEPLSTQGRTAVLKKVTL